MYAGVGVWALIGTDDVVVALQDRGVAQHAVECATVEVIAYVTSREGGEVTEHTWCG